MARKILRHTAEQIDNAIDDMQDATDKINKQNQLLESVANSGDINESTLSQVMLNKVSIDTLSSELIDLEQRILNKKKYLTQEEYDELEANGELDETIEYNIY